MVYVSCGGYIRPYKNMKEVMTFFKECASWCEGSERERYMTIVLEALDNIDKDEVCISDGMKSFGIDFDIMEMSEKQLATIRKGFGITAEELAGYAARYNARKEEN